ncbi:HNH endonuclease [Vibrio vulnificus]|nr:HNH endonuclease [Vibrio vulnificus]
MSSEYPKVPYDLAELAHIETLLNKVDDYEKALMTLESKIKIIATKASEHTYSNSYEIEELILKSFYLNLENRSFNGDRSISKLKAEIKHHGIIKNRNLPCEICGENRSIDKCHIIPDKLGGLRDDSNLVYLCPTHHRLFDRFLLSQEEWVKIDWSRKSVASQEYIDSVTLPSHRQYWQQAQETDYERVKFFESNEKPFIGYVVKSLLSLLVSGELVDRANLYKVIDPNIRELAKKVLPLMLKKNLVSQIKQGSRNMVCISANNEPINEEIIARIWQEI